MPRRALVVIALCALLAVACSSPSHKYTADTEGAFMESCTVRQGQPRSICKCTYDSIAQQIPFDRYVELDKQLQADPNAVPDELIHIVSDCGSRLSSSSSSSS